MLLTNNYLSILSVINLFINYKSKIIFPYKLKNSAIAENRTPIRPLDKQCILPLSHRNISKLKVKIKLNYYKIFFFVFF